MSNWYRHECLCMPKICPLLLFEKERELFKANSIKLSHNFFEIISYW